MDSETRGQEGVRQMDDEDVRRILVGGEGELRREAFIFAIQYEAMRTWHELGQELGLPGGDAYLERANEWIQGQARASVEAETEVALELPGQMELVRKKLGGATPGERFKKMARWAEMAEGAEKISAGNK
jgi:hypothetical protein